VGGARVRPFDVTTRLLFDAWKLPEGEDDLTVMRVRVDGTRGGEAVTLVWDLYDERDPVSGYTSMSRTTGFPCALVARRLARGQLHRPGVQPPERLADDEALVDDLLAGLRERGIQLDERTEPGDGG
jgi:saccharopine dehydrogenase-like NADP-dependent oxidoreductase